jgi:Zn-dependent peptidase ImmA (M78 family)
MATALEMRTVATCADMSFRDGQEAQWLAGALLISEEAALTIVRSKSSLEDAAQRYGASIDMVRGRLNVTSARKRAELAARPRQRRAL